MKLQYKQQRFQADAAKAVVDVFAGQPYLTSSYMIDYGSSAAGQTVKGFDEFVGWRNEPIVPELSSETILKNLQNVQKANQLNISDHLEGKYNLTIEMETGVGKTYTYIKTMYELNRAYGWSKFIIVVPSIAIREGVYKTFQTTEEHFAEVYSKKIRYFIYNSAQLTEIDRFASDNSINVMIINSQAFNAKGEAHQRIYKKLDEFRSRRPIDIIAKTNPVVIIDEPQSVEGARTKERLKEFNALMTLRYSATPREQYNLVYRLDAMDAYNKKLVKKISVKGISKSGTESGNGFVYLEGINLSEKDPTATITFNCTGANSVKKVTRKVSEGFNLYPNSNNLEEYRNNYVVSRIDGRDNHIEFVNGIKIFAGDISGKVDDNELRRIQIRETIISHIEREQQLYRKGIKVLSLFFIDQVDHYRQYDENGNPRNGIFAQMFEEEYENVVGNLLRQFNDEDYMEYLDSIKVSKTHAGYFSIDKKGHMINSKVGRNETSSDDVSAYDLIMKDKERLLDLNPKRSPVRFIFSHSALKEGWDNPNVFQICTLKDSDATIKKRQEVGRGMRLCVNQEGERMDENVLGNNVQRVNLLTVIASESYEKFAKTLQTEIADAVADRPKEITEDLFKGKTVKDDNGNEYTISRDRAAEIVFQMTLGGYLDRHHRLTPKYYEDKAGGTVQLAEEIKPYQADVQNIIDSVFNEAAIAPENARSNNVELKLDEEKLNSREFKALWSRINSKSVYVVDFDTDELIRKAITALNEKLRVSKIFYTVTTGKIDEIKSKQELQAGTVAFRTNTATYTSAKQVEAASNVKYDLIGKIVEGTGLTRKDAAAILKGIEKIVFEQFKNNPEEFILKAVNIINEEKATVIIEHITYNVLDEKYDTSVFTDATIKGKLGANAMKANHHLYDHIVYDSTNEHDFAEALDTYQDVAVYVKLPNGFYINTPVGHYNPDWAIAFKDGTVKHVYFVAETKGSMSTMELRAVEKAKIDCAREHFRAISGDNIVYDVVDSYTSLLQKVMK